MIIGREMMSAGAAMIMGTLVIALVGSYLSPIASHHGAAFDRLFTPLHKFGSASAGRSSGAGTGAKGDRPIKRIGCWRTLLSSTLSTRGGDHVCVKAFEHIANFLAAYTAVKHSDRMTEKALCQLNG
jgi:hypothetical protein